MFISAGREEIFDFAIPMGIGSHEITINLTRLILFNKPEYIVFVGSVGSYGRLKIFDIIESTSSTYIPHCFLEKNCYTPISNKIVSRETVVVNSTDYITTSSLHSKAYLKLGIDAENMEFYSVMRVCKEFNIGAFGIFIVTNYCDKDAHYQYIKNINEAKARLIDYIRKKFGLKV